MGGFVLSAWAGGAANSDLQRSQARAEWVAADGGLRTRQFARRLTAETSAAYGLGAAYWFDKHWGLRVRGGLSPSHLEISVSERETAGIPFDSAVTGPARYRSMRVWTYDAQLLVRAPITPRGRIAPFGFLGAGRLVYDAAGTGRLPPEAASTFQANRRPGRFAIVLGASALVPLQRENLALSFELSAHALRTPVEPPARSRLTGDQIEVIMSPATGAGGSEPVRLTTHVELLIGLSWFAR
jgi:hypothetical protein